MESHFEITVSRRGIFLFSTSPRSISACDSRKFKKMMSLLKEKFPESEGYNINAVEWDIIGLRV